MPVVFSNPLSAAPRIFALSLMLGEVAWAASHGGGPVRIEAFTVHDLPIQGVRGADSPSASMTVEVYALDGIERFETKLSEQLPTDSNAARRAALKRVSQVDAVRIEEAQRAAIGLVRAAEYGTDRYPAIIFDGQAVVYGITDIGEALRHYRMWQGKTPR